jgi:hypothetical protein
MGRGDREEKRRKKSDGTGIIRRKEWVESESEGVGV